MHQTGNGELFTYINNVGTEPATLNKETKFVSCLVLKAPVNKIELKQLKVCSLRKTDPL